MDERENIFDDDDALDYILYEDAEKDIDKSKNQGGCLGLALIFIIPSFLLGVLTTYL